MTDPQEHPSALSPRGMRSERFFLPFVLLVLATLVTVPLIVNQRVGDLREDIEASEPSRTLVTALQFNLVREMAALSELMLTADTASTTEYDASLLREDSIYRELEPLVRQLGPEVVAQYQEVRRLALLWHDRAADAQELLADPMLPSDPPRRRERRLFDELLESTARLDAAILQRTMDIRRRIGAAEQLGLNLSILLGILAIVAGAAASVLAGRSRRFAVESERRRREAESALQAVARATELREHLVRGITHDVKNPLGAAKGYAELLSLGVKAPVLPEQLPLIRGIQRSVDSALAIIADLLDVARADSGRLSVEPVETDLGEVVRVAMDDHRAAAESAGLSLHFEAPTEPVCIETDPTRVGQILQNLLSNAIKYTPAPGSISLSVRLEQDGRRRGDAWAVVTVSDTGPGVPAELREHIFEEFTRLEDRDRIQGHGLGLAIARRLARLLGGELTLADSEAPGATFELWLAAHDGAPRP